jgi:hypothetical protein
MRCRGWLAWTCGALLACSGRVSRERIAYADPLDSVDALITKSGVSLDRGISHDGKGSIRVEAKEPASIRLAELHPEGADGATLFYRAHLRSENLKGQAFLEMWCVVPGKGEFFSRALQAPLTGTVDWVSQQTPFFLEAGQRCETVKLNLAVAGTGTVWIDDPVLAIASR